MLNSFSLFTGCESNVLLLALERKLYAYVKQELPARLGCKKFFQLISSVVLGQREGDRRVLEG